MTNIWLYLKLLGATVLVLTPGIAFARALGVKGVSAMLAWALTLLFGALAVTFMVGTSLVLTSVLLAVAGVSAVGVRLVVPRTEHNSVPWA